MMVSVTVHRGTNQIGGTCIELRNAKSERLILDAGRPLDAPRGATGLLPASLDLSGTASVLICHAHQDHDSRSLFFFAGIWTPWQGTRGSMKNPQRGEHQLFAFLTCEPNAVVKPVHPKAMPVILTTKKEIETWMSAEWSEAKALQRPLDDDLLLEVVPIETEEKQGRLL